MRDYIIGRVCVRLFTRPRSAPWRPFFHNKTVIAAFGAGPFGVQIMRVWTQEEFETFNRPAMFKLRAIGALPPSPPDSRLRGRGDE
jgi:hypothetical protein